MVGIGLTVKVKTCAEPLQPFALGTTEILALPELLGVKLTILPIPVAANPIAVFVFVQLKVVLATFEGELKVMPLILPPKHIVWLAPPVTVGIGLTVIVKVCAAPEHIPKEGVTVMVAVTLALELLIGLKAGIVPDPEPNNPIVVVLLVQL